MKAKYGQACENIVPTKLRNVFEADVLNLLPTRDQHGRRLLVLEAGSKFTSIFLPQESSILSTYINLFKFAFVEKWKPSQVPLVDLFRGIQLTVLGSMVEPYSQICGAVVIVDMEGNEIMSRAHNSRLTSC